MTQAPVTNPALVAALANVARAPSDATKDALLVALNSARYLVPMLTDEMRFADPDADGNAAIEKGSFLKFLTTKDSEGNAYLPLFSDWDALRAFLGPDVSAFAMSAADAWQWTLDMEDIHGAVINPAENALPLERHIVQFLSHSLAAKLERDKTPKAE